MDVEDDTRDMTPHHREFTQSHSQETLRRVKENDETLKTLWIGGAVGIDRDDEDNEVIKLWSRGMMMPLREYDGAFNPNDDRQFTSLSEYIASNTHITKLVHVDGRVGLDVECLRRNSSIHELSLTCGWQNMSDGSIYDILQVYQEKNNLTCLSIQSANLQNGEVDVLVNTLRQCMDLKNIKLCHCNITDEALLEIVEEIRGHRMLKMLDLGVNSIGNVGCEAIATFLDDPNCNIQTLSLTTNNIDNDDATAIANILSNNKKLQTLDLRANSIDDEGMIAIANGLANNTTLQILFLHSNPIDPSVVEESFCKVLCNTSSSIARTHASNHTMKLLDIVPQRTNGEPLLSLLKYNRGGATKADIAMKKILKFYPDMDMEPLFECDAAEGERNLKALPYVVDWFKRARKVVGHDWNTNDKEVYGRLLAQEVDLDEDVEEERFIVEKRKLDAIFQFALAMPLLFEGVTNM